MEKYHIGHEIEKEMRAQGMTARQLANEINLSPQAVYDIFKKDYIATDRLAMIQRVLERDFFKELSEALNNGGMLAEKEDESVIKERIEMLMPEDKLHVLDWEQYHDLAEEFIITEHHKPLIIYANDWAAQTSVINHVADSVLGIGKVYYLDLQRERKNGKTNEEMIQKVKTMPHPFIQVGSLGGDEDLRFLVDLAQLTGKKVFAYCRFTQTIENYNGNTEYHDTAIRTFGTWQGLIHFALVDDNFLSYRQMRQVYLADWGEDILSFIRSYMPDARTQENDNIVWGWLNDLDSLYRDYGAWLDVQVKMKKWLKGFNLMYIDDRLDIKKDGERWTISLPVGPITENSYGGKLMNKSPRRLSLWVEVQNDDIVDYEGSITQFLLGEDEEFELKRVKS